MEMVEDGGRVCVDMCFGGWKFLNVQCFSMERASFYFQIFFESIDLQEKLSSEFTILVRLFQLPVIEIDKLQGPPGFYEIQTGKRLSLKMPFIEVLDECPMFVLVRTPRPGHTSERRCQHRVKLQNVFRHAIETPRRYVQQKFKEVLKGKNDQPFASVVFTVSVCYTSSTQEAVTNFEPIILQPQLSPEFEISKPKNTGKKDMATNTRPPLAPEPPETRTRSIFYFDRKDLMEENKQLAAEIRRLTDLVQRMKVIVEEHKAETKPRRAQARSMRRGPPPANPEVKARTDYIYHPQGMSLRWR